MSVLLPSGFIIATVASLPQNFLHSSHVVTLLDTGKHSSTGSF